MSEDASSSRLTKHIPWLWLVIAFVVIVGGAGLWAYVAGRPSSATVVRRDIVAYLPLHSELVVPPQYRADVMPPYRARVASVYVGVGDTVHAGDPIVELALPSAQLAFSNAQKALQAAQTAYAEARREHLPALEAARQKVRQARAAMKAAGGTAAPTSNAPSTPSSSGGAAVQETTPSQGSASSPTPAAPAGAKDALKQAMQELAQAQAEFDAAMTPYRQQLEAAQVAFKEAQAGRNAAIVRAPISGQVLALNAQPGGEIGAKANSPVATIVDLSELQVQAELAPDQVALVKDGATAAITFDELSGQRFTGSVLHITTLPPTRTRGERYLAIIRFENPNGVVKPNMRPHAAIEIGEARNALAVPNGALEKNSEGVTVVQVLRNGQWRQAVVETGITDGQYTEVRSGVRDGEVVRVRRIRL
jgi:multidrug efflux pump subunit AcrA (membrane-fusion protein)